MEIGLDITREGVMNFLSSSVIYGNLGLFIGAGFSKAVLQDELEEGALSWGQLIEKTCNELSIDYSTIEKVGVSYPEIATLICEKYAYDSGITYEEAKARFKSKVCELTNWYPNGEQRGLYSDYLNRMDPKWVITTNYDLVIESLLTGRCISIGPQDYLTSPKDVIPVYHLHGIRHNPDSIVITQEDYVTLFRPNEYRQIKLSLTIKESTTLILGYGLGDVNVLSAVDWSKNIYKESKLHPHEIVQVLRVVEPKMEPYFDKNNIIIIETDEIENFLMEFNDILLMNLEKHQQLLDQIKRVNGELTDSKEKNVNRFINEQKLRLNLLKALSEFEVHMISPFIDFLSRCIDKTWENSMPQGAFHGYDENLTILMDIIINIEFKKMPPALFEFVAYSLDRVLYYVGSSQGKSHRAERTWQNNGENLPLEIKNELYRYSKRKGYSRLSSRLKPLLP